MHIRHNLLPAAVLATSLGLATACSGGEAPAPEDTHTVPPAANPTEPSLAHPSMTMDDLSVRVIQAEDAESKPAGTSHQVATANIMSRAGLLGQESTNNQWQTIFGKVERVSLGYKASRQLCAASVDNWDTSLRDVRHDILEAAGDPKEDFAVTLISYGFKTCQPQTKAGHEDQRIPGEATRQEKVVDFLRGVHSAQYVLHQLGHYYGLGHARLNTCDQEAAGGYCFSTRAVYADPSNVMGETLRQDNDAFNSPQLDRTGVLDQEQIIDVKESSTFTIGSLVGSSDKPRVLRIPKTGDDAEQKYFYVELSDATDGSQGASLKVYGTPDMHNPPTTYPSTVLYKLGSGAEVGSVKPSKRQVFAAAGLHLYLKSLMQSTQDGGGSAQVRIELDNSAVE